MRALTGLLRTNEALGGLAARAFGSVVSAEASSPFVKYASPVPTPIDYSPLLASLPETQVGKGAQRTRRSRHISITSSSFRPDPACR